MTSTKGGVNSEGKVMMVGPAGTAELEEEQWGDQWCWDIKIKCFALL